MDTRLRSFLTPAVAAIVVLAGVVRFRGLAFGLPHTQARPDETFIIEAVRTLLSGRVPHFYDYPWLYMWMLSALYVAYYACSMVGGTFHSIADMVASWSHNWTPFFLISRGLSAALGTATVIVIFHLGRRLWGEATGLVAAFFLTLAFIHVRDSHFGTTDVAMTFFIVVAVLGLVVAHAGRTRSQFALAGFAAGIAAATKYNAVLLAAPFVASYLVHIFESAGRRREAALDTRLLISGGAFLAAFSVGIPFVFLDRAGFVDAMRLLIEAMQRGDMSVGLTNGWIHHVQFSLRYGVGVPLLLAGIVGSIAMLTYEPLVAALVLSFPIAYYVAAGTVSYLFFRYAIPIVPFVCLAAAWLVCRSADALARRIARPSLRVPLSAALVALASIAVVLPSARSVWAFDRVIRRTDNRVVLARWFAENVPPGSSVLQSGSPYGHAQFAPALGYTEWVWHRKHLIFRVKGRPASGRPDWIVLQESPLPSYTQPIVRELLQSGYARVAEFKAVSIGNGLVYDRSDAFFVPFSGFERVIRPGPNFTVFRRLGPVNGEALDSDPR